MAWGTNSLATTARSNARSSATPRRAEDLFEPRLCGGPLSLRRLEAFLTVLAVFELISERAEWIVHYRWGEKSFAGDRQTVMRPCLKA